MLPASVQAKSENRNVSQLADSFSQSQLFNSSINQQLSLTSNDLALLDQAGDDFELLADSLASKISVWTDDDISPASHIYSHKTANAILQWSPQATSRLLLPSGNGEVVLH